MSAASDDLTKPLAGPRRGKRFAPRLVVPWTKTLGSFAGVIGVALAVYLAIAEDPLGGEPHAVAPIEIRDALVGAGSGDAAGSDGARIAEVPRGTATAVEIEAASGVSVVRPDGGSGSSSVLITIPQDPRSPASGMASPSQPVLAALRPAPDPRLVERTRYGILPRIGDDGARAWDVYSRTPPPAPAGIHGRVAILVTGLGISLSATNEAIVRLPPEISLAFAPYGGDLDRSVSRARSDGHEVMLQAPMEPFDYPDNDPGPHTLTVKAGEAANLEKLHWVMGRFAGYTGIVNFMGARLTADAEALAPIIAELGARGLAIVDDGTSPRSLIAARAGEAGVPAARANLILDAVPRAEAIDAMLQRLEEQARADGFALGIASALPVSVERIARWAGEAGERGVILVPVSAAFRDGVGG